jgi:hypothetical protein
MTVRIFSWQNFRVSLIVTQREVRTEGRKDHKDSITVGQRAEAWYGSVLHPAAFIGRGGFPNPDLG